jgi:WD40 repeat protein
MSFSYGGGFLGLGTKDKRILLFYINNETITKLPEIDGHNSEVWTIQFAHKSMRFLSASKEERAYIWTYDKKEWQPTVIDASLKLNE